MKLLSITIIVLTLVYIAEGASKVKIALWYLENKSSNSQKTDDYIFSIPELITYKLNKTKIIHAIPLQKLMQTAKSEYKKQPAEITIK
ncbi:MAG: hypothetical protein ABIA63_12230 [bacterium]